MRNWAMWNCTKRLNWKRWPQRETIELKKRYLEREKIELKKMPKKGKYWNEKDAQMGKDYVEKDKKMVYLLLTFLFRQIN